MCGENWWDGLVLVGGEGSSPRVRGKLIDGILGMFSAGLIPACAGKTWPAPPSTPSNPAHPRVCGENGVGGGDLQGSGGSSPRVRGKPTSASRWAARLGLIPACAGKTRTRGSSPSPRRAHPRVCGENRRRTPGLSRPLGSSPRVRGKPAAICEPPTAPGLIPACAGKTCGTRRTPPTWRAHPRVCGENERGGASWRRRPGSSPRVRGKRFLTWAFTARVGRILETLEPYAFSGSYSFPGARANGGQRRAHRRGLCTGPALGRPLGAS